MSITDQMIMHSILIERKKKSTNTSLKHLAMTKAYNMESNLGYPELIYVEMIDFQGMPVLWFTSKKEELYTMNIWHLLMGKI